MGLVVLGSINYVSKHKIFVRKNLNVIFPLNSLSLSLYMAMMLRMELAPFPTYWDMVLTLR